MCDLDRFSKIQSHMHYSQIPATVGKKVCLDPVSTMSNSEETHPCCGIIDS